MNDYLNNIVDSIQNFSDKFEFMINNFNTVYILIILVYAACILILINQHNINRKLDKLLLLNNKSEESNVANNKLSKLLGDLGLSILTIMFLILVLVSIV